MNTHTETFNAREHGISYQTAASSTLIIFRGSIRPLAVLGVALRSCERMIV